MNAHQAVAHDLGPVEVVPVGEGREFLVDGRRIAVFRPRSGTLAATDAVCPHRQGPLADGIIGMDSVVCPLHGRRFSLTSGEDDAGPCAVRVYPVESAGGRIVLTLAGEEIRAASR
ncbi:MAG: nitrite reductase (NAD(P)H) small subunit [Thermoleophilia bacterium]|nr:nitrite reductase (NAD(P)H) small subunit [Thermoleophilia bacterium]